jgi:hypothetical protein
VCFQLLWAVIFLCTLVVDVSLCVCVVPPQQQCRPGTVLLLILCVFTLFLPRDIVFLRVFVVSWFFISVVTCNGQNYVCKLYLHVFTGVSSTFPSQHTPTRTIHRVPTPFILVPGHCITYHCYLFIFHIVSGISPA